MKVFVFLVLFLPLIVLSEEPKVEKKISSHTDLKWYRPTVKESPKQGRLRVLLTGRASPGMRVSVNRNQILTVDKQGKILRISKESLIVGNFEVITNPDGYFVLALDLPESTTVNLPLLVSSSKNSKSSKRVQLNLAVSKVNSELMTQVLLPTSPFLRNKYRVWMGLGYNFLRYGQSSEDINSDLEFKVLRGPSTFLKASMWLDEHWDFSAAYKVSPGAANSSAEIQISSGNYHWTTFSLEATKYPDEWLFKVFDRFESRLGYRFGLQHHSVPFLSRTGSSETDFEIIDSAITMLTGGIQHVVVPRKDWTVEWFLRYQYPVATGDTTTITPSFAFDGSLGMTYEFLSNYVAGLFWYGQWHEYGFGHLDRFSNENILGDQALFFSTIDLRLSYQF